jgi:hypothetical protein
MTTIEKDKLIPAGKKLQTKSQREYLEQTRNEFLKKP